MLQTLLQLMKSLNKTETPILMLIIKYHIDDIYDINDLVFYIPLNSI